MGIFGALINSVSGLKAQSFALENISGNIANSQTTGFKRTETAFSDLVADAVPKRQIAGGVLGYSRSTNTVQGDIQNASVDTFMAINGEGFFVVQRPGNFVDGRPIFEGVDLYTRRGDFQLDRDGYLVNGAGYYLKAMEVDPATGNVKGSVPEILKFQNNFLPARATSEIEYRANLATYPRTSVSDPTVPGSELISPASFTTVPIPMTARLVGTSATLLADAPAVRTGTLDISGLSSAAGGTLVLNGSNIVVAPGATALAVATAINGVSGTTGVSASINATGRLVLTSADADTNIDIGAGSTAGLLTELGLASGVTSATNLISQSAVSAGQTLTVQVSSGAAQTITFGTGGGQVSTMAELSAALAGLTGVAASVNTSNGNVSIIADSMSDALTVGGTATATNFGLTASTVNAWNGDIVTANDATSFLAQSVSGGAVTAYNDNGAPVNIQLRWAKSASASYPGQQNTWHLFYQENGAATGAQTAWRRVQTTYRFDSSGQLDPPITSVSIPNVAINGIAVGDITLNHGVGGLSQYADPNGNVSLTKVQQNGYAAGDLVDIAVSEGGRIVANYSNGRSAEIAEIPLYSFYGTNFLKKLDGGAFAQTSESGPPIADATGNIIGRSLEGSNTDIADEFTKLIVTQQAYAANTRVVTTANDMLREVLQMSR